MDASKHHQSTSSFLTSNNLQSNTLFTLKEEYCSKLEKLVDQNSAEKTHLLNQISGLIQKTESMTA